MGQHSIIPIPPIIRVAFSSVLMSATQTSNVIQKMGGRTKVGARITTVQGVGAPDHVGTVTWLGSNYLNSALALVLAIPQTAILNTGAVHDSIVQFDCYFPYLYCKYTRTSGGDDDLLTVNVSLSV